MAEGKASTILKWVGYATAILSLIAGVRELVVQISEHQELNSQVKSLLASEKIQRRNKDYPAAWQSLDQAVKLQPDAADVRDAQEDLAMQWLENIHVGEGVKFSDIADKLDPVLTHGMTLSNNPQHQADLEAHLGWSYFLRSRDSASSSDPAASYADAIKKDSNNPYAQAMWGHWILWNHDSIQDAETHFSTAIASNRQKEFVRNLQLSALLNNHDNPAEEEVIRVADAVRKEQGTVSPDLKQRIFSLYYGKLFPADRDTPRFINAVPPAEHLATFHWLFDDLSVSESNVWLKRGYLAVLEESAGQRDQARTDYDVIRRHFAGEAGSLLDMAQAGSIRLSNAKSN